jgi:hypothetical protein
VMTMINVVTKVSVHVYVKGLIISAFSAYGKPVVDSGRRIGGGGSYRVTYCLFTV